MTGPTATPSTDTAQTLFTIPAAITDAFKNVSSVIEAAQKADWLGLAFIAGGLVMVMVTLSMILVEETIQKPGREFVAGPVPEKIARLVKGG